MEGAAATGEPPGGRVGFAVCDWVTPPNAAGAPVADCPNGLAPPNNEVELPVEAPGA